MNGAATVTATTEDHQHQHQQGQNETTSEHPRSPASPLSVRHGEQADVAETFVKLENLHFRCFTLSAAIISFSRSILMCNINAF